MARRLSPIRAFLLSFVGGLLVLSSGYGVLAVALANPPEQRLTA